MKHDVLLEEMVARLGHDIGAGLISVVLYGPQARGDEPRAAGHLHLMLVLTDLERDMLMRLTAPVQWWLGKDQPWPRLFTRRLIADSRDVFPIEFLDIARHHRVLYGEELGEIALDRRHLRIQCERELREKLMRLCEAYIECRGRRRPLLHLLRESYASFVPIWRACLYLLDAPIPIDDGAVAQGLCERLDLPHAPLSAAAAVAAGERPVDPEDIFAGYYRVACAVTRGIDRYLEPSHGEDT